MLYKIILWMYSSHSKVISYIPFRIGNIPLPPPSGRFAWLVSTSKLADQLEVAKMLLFNPCRVSLGSTCTVDAERSSERFRNP